MESVCSWSHPDAWSGRRKRAKLEEQLIVEEVDRRVREEVEKRVSAAMGSEAVQQSLQQRLVAERKVLEEQVPATSSQSATGGQG